MQRTEGSDAHERFREFCALAQANELTTGEQFDLDVRLEKDLIAIAGHVHLSKILAAVSALVSSLGCRKGGNAVADFAALELKFESFKAVC